MIAASPATRAPITIASPSTPSAASTTAATAPIMIEPDSIRLMLRNLSSRHSSERETAQIPARRNNGEASWIRSEVRSPNSGAARSGASRKVTTLNPAPATRLASIAVSMCSGSISLRWTRALANPSKVMIAESGTRISAITAWPNSAGVISRARATVASSCPTSPTPRAITIQRTPATAASRSFS